MDECTDDVQRRALAKKLRRLIRDAIGLRKQPDFAPDKYRSRVRLLDKRLTARTKEEPVDGDARRLTKRLGRHVDHIFTFLDL